MIIANHTPNYSARSLSGGLKMEIHVVLLVLVLFLWLKYSQLREQHRVERETERKEKLAIQKIEARRTRFLKRKRILRR